MPFSTTKGCFYIPVFIKWMMEECFCSVVGILTQQCRYMWLKLIFYPSARVLDLAKGKKDRLERFFRGVSVSIGKLNSTMDFTEKFRPECTRALCWGYSNHTQTAKRVYAPGSTRFRFGFAKNESLLPTVTNCTEVPLHLPHWKSHRVPFVSFSASLTTKNKLFLVHVNHFGSSKNTYPYWKQQEKD